MNLIGDNVVVAGDDQQAGKYKEEKDRQDKKQ